MKKLIFSYLILISIHAIAADMTMQNDSLPNDHPWALIAGGSKGIGYAIAEALAERKYNLVLIARGADSLVAAKHKLETKYNIHVEWLQYDLSKENAATEIAEWCEEKNLPLKMLCNVAGFGGEKDYLNGLTLDTLRYMVRLNVESAMALSYTLLPMLQKNSPAYILNVSSMAGFAPIPEKNMYSATKAAIISFSYALRAQLKDMDISVSCLAPGPVFTKPSIVKDTKEKLGKYGEWMAVPPAKVGEIAVRKTLRGKLMIVPGTLASVNAFFIRLMPKRMVVFIYDKLGKK